MSYACFIYHSRNSLITYIVLFIMAAVVLSLSMSPWNISLKPTLVLFGLYILLQFAHISPEFATEHEETGVQLEIDMPNAMSTRKCPMRTLFHLITLGIIGLH